jgi:hypothetical protein
VGPHRCDIHLHSLVLAVHSRTQHMAPLLRECDDHE